MKTAPFAPFEWMIAWRYLRARRAEGGVSTMTWISLIGVTLAVFALVATLAVRAGFRAEFVDTVLGTDAHVTVYSQLYVTETGQTTRALTDYAEMAERVSAVGGVLRAAPLVKGQVLANLRASNAGVEVFGITKPDLLEIPGIAGSSQSLGSLESFGTGPGQGIAIGSGVAREIAASVGDKIKLISPNGVRTAFGTSPRVNAYEVAYIFHSGRFLVDKTRVFLPFDEAQAYFNKEGVADEIQVMLAEPEAVDAAIPALLEAAGERALVWTWRDSAGAFLRALQMQDNALFILLAILVMIATMNIVSGLIMLVKNKGRDIGILRTVGLTEGAILRVFLIVGASIGVVGTALGVGIGVLFALNIESIYQVVDLVTGQQRQSLERDGYIFPPALLLWSDLARAVGLSLGLSFVVTIFPARRAARMNPVEALRYE
ncbi:Lipoprotein releasing system transmembrane protein LolC [Candidatus Rhodobacter oscarellae]|uniref:Lipoprotein releasing system transmembrane protein LolC n=1 Tax=Candidatus Rhodobacter oscarellae TaxID=1675527 RepID=A0A0J9E767_9RHOB|nr:ABC transporter permease [Candidatus Rhodobacter lobularis]KMW57609.1 Lipoprotein releasing system transmembrane protein LolC [Candidatus Rhodobacter lobularis]